MNEAPGVRANAPKTWLPLPLTLAQLTGSACFALRVDDLSLTLRAWRALASDSALLLPECTPYPGTMSSPLRLLADRTLKLLLPSGLERVWVKRDDHLPLSQSLSDRGVSYAVLTLISEAMIAAGLTQLDQPLKGVDQPATRAWLSEHQLMIRGPVRDALAAGRICRALGLPAQALLPSDTASPMAKALLDLGVRLCDANVEMGAHQRQQQMGGAAHRLWWLDTAESHAALQGYACAALELKQQLFSHGIHPSTNHPLLIFLASGNGLGAAGLARGVKAVFGPYASMVLVEDAHRLKVLPTLCRWPKDPDVASPVFHSVMGTNALVAVVDAEITVDDSHRQHACKALSASAQAQLGRDTISLFTAAAEHLRRRLRDQPHVLFWLKKKRCVSRPLRGFTRTLNSTFSGLTQFRLEPAQAARKVPNHFH